MKHANKKQKISLHNRDLRIMSADFWHQPDGMEQQFYYIDEKSKICDERNADHQHTQEYLQNDSEKSISIDILSNDCLRHIFKVLLISDQIRAESVCKRWKAASLESWHTMKVLDFFSSKWRSVNMNIIYALTLHQLLLRCGRFLTLFDLSNSHYSLPNDVINIAGQFCPNLMNVDITGITTSRSDINALARNCKNITRFILGESLHDLDTKLCDLYSIHKNLEYLEINNNMLSDKCFAFLSAETIHTLILYNCSCIHDRYLSRALEKLKGLEKLVINESTSVNECTLRNISQYCTNLKILSLHKVFSESIMYVY